MKIRLAKKIMKHKPLRPGEQLAYAHLGRSRYWRRKFIKYTCDGLPFGVTLDHRITKAISLISKYNKKYNKQ